MKFNNAIIPFALVRYEIGYSQLAPTGLVATGFVGYLPSRIQRALMEKLFNNITMKAKQIKTIELHYRMMKFLMKKS